MPEGFGFDDRRLYAAGVNGPGAPPGSMSTSSPASAPPVLLTDRIFRLCEGAFREGWSGLRTTAAPRAGGEADGTLVKARSRGRGGGRRCSTSAHPSISEMAEEKRIKRHGRYVVFQLAEVAVPRALFASILRRIDDLRPRPPPLPA
jgi:hypothetical protein